MSNLRPYDLKGVILSYFSVDEFQPKTGTPEDVVVIAFYAGRENAAEDLKHFIETGMFDILDVEKSDVPDDKNRFLVFVEMNRDEGLIESLVELLRDIENVTGDMSWVFSSYMNNRVRKASPKKLKSNIITNKETYKNVIQKEERRIRRNQKIKEIDQHVQRFVQKSYVDAARFKIEDGKKVVVFYYSDADFKGTFDYKLHALKTRAQLADMIEGVKGREGTLPTSVLQPLAILFGKNYKVYNQDNLIFVVPEFDLNLIMVLGVK